MTAVEATPEASGAHKPSTAYVMRVATAYLVVEHDAPDRDVGLAKRLVAALNEDPRVIRADVPDPLDEYWSPQFSFYPGREGEDTEAGVAEGTRHLHAQRFSAPIIFNVHVPTKNQPTVFASDELPTEDYFVVWNGKSLIVSWEHEPFAPMPSSGGHVVRDILEQATQKVGTEVFFQACNPSCTWLFAHVAIHLVLDPGADRWRSHHDPSASVQYVTAPLTGPGDVEDATLDAWYRYHDALRDFADMKNLGRQVLDLEHFIRVDLQALNSLHHTRARTAQRPLRQRLREQWEGRGWRRRSRFYLARLWLALGSLELRRREWEDEFANYRRSVSEADAEELFGVDANDEIASVGSLDLSLIEASLQHASTRLDTGAVVAATLGGAIAGAVAAAAVGLL